MTNGVEVSSRANAIIIPADLQIRPKVRGTSLIAKTGSVEIATFEFNRTELD
jgi:hypothetical protein